jgi:UDP-glucose 4-epimerase
MSGPRVLITGGAGFIGSVVVEDLLANGAERVVVLDNLSTGHEESVLPPARFERGDIADSQLVSRLVREERIEAVIHLAASSVVGDSMSNPAAYYENNVVKGLALLDAVATAGVRSFVFSSTAAVYQPSEAPLTEESNLAPANPYGETKRTFEGALAWYGKAYGLRHVSMRYFNAAGATQHCGEQHLPETHLIPLVLAAASGARPSVTVFGDDYATPDGTCVRDYVHVADLARAHVLALRVLDGARGGAYNLGCGGGYSVAQVIEVARRVTGKTISVVRGSRRPGDPAVLVASSQRAQRELGWTPARADLAVIVEDAWKWHLAHPQGYRSR